MRNIPLMAKKSAPSVLVVDDEALIRWSLTEMLGERGYAVTEAGDARMAVAAIENADEPFDVVLLDYRLPDSADLRLLEKVRRLAPTSQVIMITAHNSPGAGAGRGGAGRVSRHQQAVRGGKPRGAREPGADGSFVVGARHLSSQSETLTWLNRRFLSSTTSS